MSGVPKWQAEPHKPETTGGSGHSTDKGNTFRRLGILRVAPGRLGSEEQEGQGALGSPALQSQKGGHPDVTW